MGGTTSETAALAHDLQLMSPGELTTAERAVLREAAVIIDQLASG